MKQVWKFELSQSAKSTYLRMPLGAVILSAASPHRGSLMLWALVDTEQPVEETREFLAMFTGEDVPQEEGLSFIQTIFVEEFVYHVFENTQS